MDTVDQVDGGVPVCTEKPLKGPVTGIDLAPGTKRVHGGEALRYVRSRRADGQMDFGRIQKQQQFLVNTLERLRDSVLDGPAWLPRSSGDCARTSRRRPRTPSRPARSRWAPTGPRRGLRSSARSPSGGHRGTSGPPTS
ncbi:LCP family protein [Streptomyces sp. NPDC001728]|uniref:LCP family protein n=1 Tax=Streptomyces sp. NPDC001728 TaxID=3154396 RepID=UPI003325C241